MRFIQNTHCGRCGSGYCHVYSTKVPIKSLTAVTVLIFVALMALVSLVGVALIIMHINSENAVLWTLGSASAVAAYCCLSFAIMAFLSRKRTAMVAICQRCNSYHLLTRPPSSATDWNNKEIEKMLSLRNLRQPKGHHLEDLYQYEADTLELPVSMDLLY